VIGELLPNVGGYRRPGAFKAEPALQFIGQQGEVERLTMWQIGPETDVLELANLVVIPPEALGIKASCRSATGDATHKAGWA